ncbi:class I SAM-dependent methyltransferase [soil metagenome]
MSLEKVDVCPVCKNPNFRPYLVCKDYTTSEELFHVEQCGSCQLLITTPRPTHDEAGSYYQSKSYISHTSAAAGIMDYLYLIIRRFTLNWKYNLIKPYLKDNRLLDMGCGTGSFLNHCKRKGINAFGVEPSYDARAAADNNQVVASLNDLQEVKFDVITMWHVMEHVYDLSGTINHLKRRLKENGTIFIAVPNWESFDATHYKELWAAYDVPRHVWHFSKSTMTTLLENEGFALKKIIPMKLDSYYVSMLSERNRTNGKLSITSILKAVLIGFRSNLKASKTMNYSSLIYVAQR